MGIPVLIIGKSGSGKSTSMRNFPDIGIINVLGKPLPFPNAPKTLITDDYNKVTSALANSKTKSVAIDDAGYLITNMFMRGHDSSGQGNAMFRFYNQVADSFWRLFEYIMYQLPPDKIVYIMMHEDKNDQGDIAPKVTGGKLLSEKVCVEGMCTICLRSVYRDGKYLFKVNTDGYDVAKTPFGMFDSDSIDNDLKVVDNKIREYYNLNKEDTTA